MAVDQAAFKTKLSVCHVLTIPIPHCYSNLQSGLGIDYTHNGRHSDSRSRRRKPRHMQHDTIIDGDFVIVTFTGEIDLEHSPAAREVLLDGLKKGRTMIVDLGGVNVIDSSGVASLLEAFQAARNKGKDFCIAAVTEPVFRVFKLARLETVFEIVDSVSDGMKKQRS